MSCFCLFGRRRPPSGVPDALGSSPKAVDGSDDNARTDEHFTPGGKKSAGTDSISPSMKNGHFHENVPDWVHKEPVHLVPADGQTYAEGTVEVKGELGSMNSGAGGFQTRATPRSVFRQAAAQPPSRTSNPHAPQPTKSNGDWTQAEPNRHELSGNGPGVYNGAGLGGGTDMLVHDTDALCLPGTEVMAVEAPAFQAGGGVGYAAANANATGINAAQNKHDSVSDSSFALATDAPLAAPRGVASAALRGGSGGSGGSGGWGGASGAPAPNRPPLRPPAASAAAKGATPRASAPLARWEGAVGGGGEGQIGGAVRGGGALAALPSAQPQALLISAPAPASTRGGVSGQISARIKERPASARSRVAMGAPPLASARSARGSSRRDTAPPSAPPAPPNRHTASRAGTDTLGDEMTPESPKNDMGRDGRLFKYPEWDEYELFDSDDLWSEHAYLLYGAPQVAGQKPAVFVWIGQYFEECDFWDDKACDQFANFAVEDFKAAFGGSVGGSETVAPGGSEAVPVGLVTLVKELEEEEDFWEYFVLG